jgi:uncharacterized protein (DUF169 family)
MDDVLWALSDKFRCHWIKVNFYQEDPKINDAVTLKDVRFCEATRKALFDPILLDSDSVSCPGARYAFGWDKHFASQGAAPCFDKGPLSKDKMVSLLPHVVRFDDPIKYIGLNIAGDPDVFMSYVSPEQMLELLIIFHNHTGKNLNTSVSALMSICSEIGAKTYLKQTVSFTFGCRDSRKYADIEKENIAVGIPRNLIHIFVNDKQESRQKKADPEELFAEEALNAQR